MPSPSAPRHRSIPNTDVDGLAANVFIVDDTLDP